MHGECARETDRERGPAEHTYPLKETEIQWKTLIVLTFTEYFIQEETKVDDFKVEKGLLLFQAKNIPHVLMFHAVMVGLDPSIATPGRSKQRSHLAAHSSRWWSSL